MKLLFKPLTCMALLLASLSAHGATWEETDGQFFMSGDLKAVKRILAKEKYSGDQLAEAFNYSAMSGNVVLTQYLEGLGWIKACNKLRSCQPMQYASMNDPKPQMVEWLLSKGFKSDRGSLESAAVLNLPEDTTISNSFAVVKIHCDNGVNPLLPASYIHEGKKVVEPPILERLTERLNSATQDQGFALLHARARAAEVITTSFIKSGLCKKGAAKSAWFDDYLKLVHSTRAGDTDLSKANAYLAANVRKEWQAIVENYWMSEAVAIADDAQRLAMLNAFKEAGWLARCRQRASCSVVDVAAESGADKTTFSFLAKEGHKLDSPNASGVTPLAYATANAQSNVVKNLCELGADFRQTTKIEIYERSIMSIAHRAYSYSWCSAAINAPLSKADKDLAQNRCEYEGGSIGSPQTGVTIPECVPGKTCMGIAFPPKGKDKEVKDLKALADIIDYYKNGLCKAPNQVLNCTANTKPYAVLIADKVQLRSEASATSNKVDTLPFGTMFEVIDSKRVCENISSREGRWIKVKVYSMPLRYTEEVKELNGWIFDAYIDYLPTLEP
ncbi:SH3 domain-containing protein [Undibacterium sp. LX40W]|uniref:SH3 domain-containing protein n=1 Tax=Undibacterium nitidum TaxID=2762298 RepID=A0A923KNH9_9BURK|nr:MULTISPECIES: SH3 domain-containing protein [Undibacterium]MBC3880683.1 SH3 domain-containing protein [Undibacterium nitidum]MBC3890582.1 SH3 domain-containing protein [Undibacterium sp. LX40W]